MKTHGDAVRLITIAALLALPTTFRPSAAHAQTGTVEFVARVTPASGRAEPVLRQTFFLLRKSYREIGDEAEKEEPKPDLDKFVDKLQVTPELKAWMKRMRSTTIIGEEFHKRLTEDDVFKVPEFLNAYIAANLADPAVGFPKAKMRERDKTAHPERYEQARKQYFGLLRRYLQNHPESVDTIDLHLSEWDATPAWEKEMTLWRQQARERAALIAQTRYLAAKTETDVQGRGSFQVEPGTYWLSTLDAPAVAGEARLRWDVSLVVAAGRITRVELSNINAVRASR